MSVTINIATVDRTSKIDWESVGLDRALTSQVDTLRFNIIRKDIGDYKPSLLDDVTLVDGSTTIFGGQIIEINESVKGSIYLEVVQVVCKDYSFNMDKSLVVATYQSQSVEDIIADINTNFLPAGYDITNVVAPITIGFIAFNYEQPSKCFQQLAELINYDWYVDYEKKIHFFAKATRPAPFDLTDTGGKYITNSLKIKKDITNLRNSIIVRGGTYEGDPITESFEADGDQTTFFQAYQYSGITVTVAGVSKTVGIDFITDPTTVDCLYNFNEKAVKFPLASRPTSGQIVAVSGNPKIPVIVKVRDAISIAQYGEFQAKVIDKSINTKAGARDRAKAEIIAWAEQINDGSFKTYQSGLAVGHQINIQSAIRNINEDFVISKISSRLHTPTELEHTIVLMTTQKFGMIEFLQKLLIQKDKEIVIDENEVVDEVEAVNEGITISEVITSSLIHNPISETATIGESATVQALNYAVEFVVGDYPTPTGTKRQFMLDGSPLA